jgi:hypothetical protein
VTTTTEDPLAHASVAEALAGFQAELPKVAKSNTADVRSDKGSYSYRYADLAELSPLVLPVLARHGLSWSTRPTLVGEPPRFVLTYTLAHVSGDKIEGDYPLPAAGSTPQNLGSAITYARRYALCAVTGVAPGDDDDDAAAASHRTSEPTGEQGGNAEGHAAARNRMLGGLRRTCEEAGWSLTRVAGLYRESHDGAELSAATAQQIAEFRKDLFARPSHELREPDPAQGEQGDATEPADAPAEEAPTAEDGAQ